MSAAGSHMWVTPEGLRTSTRVVTSNVRQAGVFAKSGATFENSPLVRQKDYVAAGLAITWVLGESATRVKVDD